MEVGDEHFFLWVHDLCGFAHEVDSGKENGGGGDAGGIACQFQAVAGEICDVLDIAIDVEVCEDGDIFLFFECIDFFHEIQRIFSGGILRWDKAVAGGQDLQVHECCFRC